MLELISLAYSPWSEKARWALEHHHVDFARTPYSPLIDEPKLRLRTRNFGRPVTVPAFYTGEGWLLDSWDIANWAEDHGTGTTLFPVDQLEEIAWYNSLSETGLEAGRAGLERMLDNPEWLDAMLPPALKPLLGPLGRPIAAAGIRRTLRKYGAAFRSPSAHRERLRFVLTTMRESLHAHPPRDGLRYVLGTFTYADIAVAQVLQFVEPTNVGGFKMAEQGRLGYRDPELAAEFADLHQWRLSLYEAHHPRHQRPAA